MPKNKAPRRLYWDSCIFIDLIEQSPQRIDTLRAIVEDVRANGNSLIYTSWFTVTEVAYHVSERASRRLDPDVLSEIDELWEDRSMLELIDLNPWVARKARELIRLVMVNGAKLTASDAVHIASAAWLQPVKHLDEFHTFDHHLIRIGEKQGIGTEIGMPICRPSITPYLDPQLGLFDESEDAV